MRALEILCLPTRENYYWPDASDTNHANRERTMEDTDIQSEFIRSANGLFLRYEKKFPGNVCYICKLCMYRTVCIKFVHRVPLLIERLISLSPSLFLHPKHDD